MSGDKHGQAAGLAARGRGRAGCRFKPLHIWRPHPDHHGDTHRLGLPKIALQLEICSYWSNTGTHARIAVLLSGACRSHLPQGGLAHRSADTTHLLR
ncbi:MAG: hypothetical protein JNJ60_16965 [Rhodocyclaceae bacterium]|nr:hypothetical protein [Rhodocyclaceae bacterium]